jgi:AraC family transcriptional regulator
MMQATYDQAVRQGRMAVTVDEWEVELLSASAYEVAYTPEHPVIGLAFDAQAGVHAYGSDRVHPFRAKPNGLAFVPAGCDVYSASPSGGEYLRIAEKSGNRFNQSNLYQFNDLIDRAAIAAAQSIRKALLSSKSPEFHAIELHVIEIVDRISSFFSGEVPNDKISTWLTPNRCRRIDEYIVGNIDKKIRVGDIAAMLDLSEGFLIRAFKASLGTSPHHYLIDRRIAYARHLLEITRQPLVDIAFAAGFSSHAHMSALFRERLGTSPGKIRNDALDIGERSIPRDA